MSKKPGAAKRRLRRKKQRRQNRRESTGIPMSTVFPGMAELEERLIVGQMYQDWAHKRLYLFS